MTTESGSPSHRYDAFFSHSSVDAEFVDELVAINRGDRLDGLARQFKPPLREAVAQ